MPLSLRFVGMWKALPMACATVVLLTAACSSSGSDGSTKAGGAAFDAKAEQLVDNVATGNIPPVLTQFSPDMAVHLSAADLQSNWKALQNDLGVYRSHGNPSGVVENGVTTERVPLEMSNGKGQVEVSYRADGAIVGLYFRKAK
jgi:hypothetical protein